MEVDPHPEQLQAMTTGSGAGTLKRSNSLPMINVLRTSEQNVPLSPTHTRHVLDTSRMRRLSSSSLNLCPNSITSLPSPVFKGTDRIHQIKQEESIEREVELERGMQSAMCMSNSLDEINLEEPMMTQGEHSRRPRSFSESLHIFTSPTAFCSSPSPTRVGKQCYSPSMQMPVRNNSFSPSPSPSPTRKSYHRSLSPIVARPTLLGKRKYDENDSYQHAAKRCTLGSGPDRLLTCIPHPLANSVSSGSIGEQSSPEDNQSQITHKGSCYRFTPLREVAECDTSPADLQPPMDDIDHSSSFDSQP